MSCYSDAARETAIDRIRVLHESSRKGCTGTHRYANALNGACLLATWLGVSHREIAELLGCSVARVYQRVKSARLLRERHLSAKACREEFNRAQRRAREKHNVAVSEMPNGFMRELADGWRPEWER